MSTNWTRERLQALIDQQVPESSVLEYKRAQSLGKQGNSVDEFTKDVSAFANAAGGTIIYGIAERKDTPPVPTGLDPVDGKVFGGEWLDQQLDRIRPKIAGIVVTPVWLEADQGHVVYVIEVPQSSTAHQATDWRYYKRRNFKSDPMADYEVRDVMNRQQTPRIQVVVSLLYKTTYSYTALNGRMSQNKAFIRVVARNVGNRVAQNVVAHLFTPSGLMSNSCRRADGHTDIADQSFDRFKVQNLVRDSFGGGSGFYGAPPTHISNRYEPILPGLDFCFCDLEVSPAAFIELRKDARELMWECQADDAPKHVGNILLSKLPLVDERDFTAKE